MQHTLGPLAAKLSKGEKSALLLAVHPYSMPKEGLKAGGWVETTFLVVPNRTWLCGYAVWLGRRHPSEGG